MWREETGMREGVKEGVEGGDGWRMGVKEGVKKGVEGGDVWMRRVEETGGGDGDERRSEGRCGGRRRG